MYHITDFKQDSYKLNEVARILNLSIYTIRNYDNNGKIKTYRTEGGHRMIMKDDLIKYMASKGLLYEDINTNNKRDVIYTRTNNTIDTNKQVVEIINNISDLTNPLILKDTGSCLDDNRTEFNKLISMVCNNEIRNVYITSKDILMIIGYECLEKLFNIYGTKIIILNNNDNTELIDKLKNII